MFMVKAHCYQEYKQEAQTTITKFNEYVYQGGRLGNKKEPQELGWKEGHLAGEIDVVYSIMGNFLNHGTIIKNIYAYINMHL